MSREQAARKRSASERAQWTRRIAPASLCSYVGTAAPPAPRFAGMRPPVNAARRRHYNRNITDTVTEAAA